MEKLLPRKGLPKGANKRVEEVVTKKNYRKFIPLIPRELYKTLADGTKVFLVDGEFIRNNIYQDWTEGGNPEAYPEFNPEGEIWIEKGMSDLDIEATIIHEKTECDWMKKGLMYEDAHNKANIQEKKYRDEVNPVRLVKKNYKSIKK